MYGLTKPTKTRTFCQPLNLNPLGPNTPRLNPNPVQTQFEPRKGLGLTQKSWGTPTHPLKTIFLGPLGPLVLALVLRGWIF